MDYDPQKIQAFLDMLIEIGVEEFEGFGIHVRFTQGLFSPDKEVSAQVDLGRIVDHESSPAPANLWQVPQLWPGGKPPSFPGK